MITTCWKKWVKYFLRWNQVTRLSRSIGIWCLDYFFAPLIKQIVADKTMLVPIQRWNLITIHTIILTSCGARRATVIIIWANKAICLYRKSLIVKKMLFFSQFLVTFHSFLIIIIMPEDVLFLQIHIKFLLVLLAV